MGVSPVGVAPTRGSARSSGGDLKSSRPFHPNDSVPAVTGRPLFAASHQASAVTPRSGDGLREEPQLAFHLSALTPQLLNVFCFGYSSFGVAKKSFLSLSCFKCRFPRAFRSFLFDFHVSNE